MASGECAYMADWLREKDEVSARGEVARPKPALAPGSGGESAPPPKPEPGREGEPVGALAPLPDGAAFDWDAEGAMGGAPELNSAQRGHLRLVSNNKKNNQI